MFKRHVLSSALGERAAFLAAFFVFARKGPLVDIFVYGDESGVFDKFHHDFFVFGGLVFLGKERKDIAARKFISAEKMIRGQYGDGELKACRLSNKHRSGLFRSTNGEIRYAFVVDQPKVNEGIFGNKKSKQRFLDYVYKVGLKSVFGRMIKSGILDPMSVGNIHIFFDEHATATDGRYELREAIDMEFRVGTMNFRYNTFHKPIFPKMAGGITLEFKDSKSTPLIRASDIIANRAFYYATNSRIDELSALLYTAKFPY